MLILKSGQITTFYMTINGQAQKTVFFFFHCNGEMAEYEWDKVSREITWLRPACIAIDVEAKHTHNTKELYSVVRICLRQ